MIALDSSVNPLLRTAILGGPANDVRTTSPALPITSEARTPVFPGLVIFVTVLGFNLFGGGLRDALDPRLK